MSFKSPYMAHRRDSRSSLKIVQSLTAIVPKDMQRLYNTMERFRWALPNGGGI